MTTVDLVLDLIHHLDIIYNYNFPSVEIKCFLPKGSNLKDFIIKIGMMGYICLYPDQIVGCTSE